ncbi:MAG: hypothetical protein IKH96_01140 [Ruminococcus sp.]|uniref:hypothetical protein n=1 Tax=Ruminococcus sp. TaxID=41978 RepID=UPI0025D2CBE4|nr:hypothetical protein [Ruminococcus sp.]MBR6994602.1 hypothetical protein [Ruminococcus sp.]
MTEKDKKRITEALGIPEPDRKKEFAEEFARRSEGMQKKPIKPIIMRITAAAAMLAVCIGALTLFPKHKTDFGGDDDIEVIETTTDHSADGAIVPHTTSSTDTEGGVTVTTAAMTSGKTGTAVTTAQNGTTKAPASQRTTAAKTTESRSESRTTTAEHHETEVTTAEPIVQDPPVTAAPPRDLTVSPDVTYTVRDNTITEEELLTGKGSDGIGAPPKGDGDPPISPNDQKIQHMFDISYAVILAKVDKMVYTSIDRQAVTAEDITVEAVYGGSLNTGDRLTVFLRGGYMPAEEYMKYNRRAHIDNAEDYSVYISAGCRMAQEEGESYIFFVSDDDSGLPDGAFSPAEDGYCSVFIKRNGKYISLAGEELSFTEEQLARLQG